MAQDLTIEIGADTKPLTRELSRTQDTLKGFASEAAKTSAALGGSLARGSNSAAFALTNLGRVAQDAPFGFIGIQNNLNPLLESFGQLRKETGSNMGALKALGQALTGPAGIGLALSAVSAGILLYQKYASSAKKTSEELGGTLLSISDLQREGNANASKEVANLQTLYSATQNLTVPMKERNRIVEELQSKYPDYFAKFTKEEVLTGKAAGQYLRLKNAIVAVGLARASEKQQSVIAEKLFNAENDRIENQIALTETLRKIKSLESQKQGTLDIQGQTALATIISGLKDNANELREAIKGSDGETKRLNGELSKTLAITDKIVSKYGAGAVVGGIGGETPKSPTSSGGSSPGASKSPLAENFRGAKVEIIKSQNELDLFLEKYRAAENLLNTKPLIPMQPGTVEAAVTAPLEKVRFDILPELTGSFQTFFDDILKNGDLSFKTLGDSIKNTFASVLASQATKGLTSLLENKGGGGSGGAVAKGLGGFLGKVIPYAGIALGAASLLGGLFKKKPSEALPSGSAIPSGSAVQTGSAMTNFNGGRVVFEIAGQKLVGVLENTLGANQRIVGRP